MRKAYYKSSNQNLVTMYFKIEEEEAEKLRNFMWEEKLSISGLLRKIAYEYIEKKELEKQEQLQK